MQKLEFNSIINIDNWLQNLKSDIFWVKMKICKDPSDARFKVTIIMLLTQKVMSSKNQSTLIIKNIFGNFGAF